MNILFVGSIWEGSTGSQRLNAFKDLGYHVTVVDTTPPSLSWPMSFLNRICFRLGFCWDFSGANKAILGNIYTIGFDVIWIEKGLMIKTDTLKKINKAQTLAKLVAYSCDDNLLRGNQSRRYLRGIPFYNVHITTKTYNVPELTAMGARDVQFFANAYDRIAYKPVQLSTEDKVKWGSDIAFLGGFQKPRYDMMLALANKGIVITIWGPGWEPYVNIHPNLIIKPGWVMAKNAAKIFCATKINLHFLHKAARDLQTTRSVEIPACCTFMLAVRTQEHQDLFTEGAEAEYFEDIEELLNKINYYLGHYAQRTAIANAGYLRCLTSGYSYHDRLSEILGTLGYK